MSQYPVILVPGIARFDALKQLVGDRLGLPSGWANSFDYFKNIKTYLELNGVENIYEAKLEFAGSVDVRSRQLTDQVNRFASSLGAAKVHIVAHSMGGLDARHAIVDHGLEDRVAKLTTIGTPHLGTVVAEKVLDAGGKQFADAIEGLVDLGGFEDLTSKACSDFNLRAEPTEAGNTVTYHAYASSVTCERTFPPLVATHTLLTRHAGDNDGLVPVSSSLWRPGIRRADGTTKKIDQTMFPFSADHLNQIGWWHPTTSVEIASLDLLEKKVHFENLVQALYLQIVQSDNY